MIFFQPGLGAISSGLLKPIFLSGHHDQPMPWRSTSRIASRNQTFEFSPDSPSQPGIRYVSRSPRISARSASVLRFQYLWKLSIILSSHARSEEHTSELQSLMRNSYAVFCLKKTKT